MRRKVLIIGRNQMLIDGFFYNMSDTLECQTSSSRTEDIASHIRCFAPEVLAVCMQPEENKETLNRIAGICKMMNGRHIPIALLGDEVECDKLTKEMGVTVDMIMSRMTRSTEIARGIITLLDDPIAKKKRADEEAAAQEPEPVSDPNARKHITIVDDDSRMLKILKEYLHEKYDVATAINGKIALKFLETKHTDLVLLDYVMPEMDGPVVYEKIRAMPERGNVPIVFLTGMSEKEKIQKVMELHPQGYLLKPVERERLLTTIQNILG